MKDRLLNSRILDQIENFKKSKIHHIIGVDSAFDNVTSYCLVREIGNGPTEILLTNSLMHRGDPKLIVEIEMDIAILARYFNAKIVRNE